jgi:signal transduction histidine kinase
VDGCSEIVWWNKLLVLDDNLKEIIDNLVNNAIKAPKEIS